MYLDRKSFLVDLELKFSRLMALKPGDSILLGIIPPTGLVKNCSLAGDSSIVIYLLVSVIY